MGADVNGEHLPAVAIGGNVSLQCNEDFTQNVYFWLKVVTAFSNNIFYKGIFSWIWCFLGVRCFVWEESFLVLLDGVNPSISEHPNSM